MRLGAQWLSGLWKLEASRHPVQVELHILGGSDVAVGIQYESHQLGE